MILGRVAGLSISVVAIMTATGAAGEPSCFEKSLVTNFGQRFDYTRDLADRARNGRPSLRFGGHDGSRWIRFRFNAEATPEGSPWSLTIRSALGLVLESYGSGVDYQRDQDGMILTGRLDPTGGIQFDTGHHIPQGKLEIRDYVVMTRPKGETTYYSLSNPAKSKWKSVNGITKSEDPRLVKDPLLWVRRGDNVGLAMLSWGTEHRACTGFAITPNIFLTNWHCGWREGLPDKHVWSDHLCGKTAIDFSFDKDGQSAEYRCEAPIAKNKELDYALLKIRPIDSQKHLTGARLATMARQQGTSLAVVHHPEADRKQISFFGANSPECIIADSKKEGWKTKQPTRFTHLCDTAPGSSGSPVIDYQSGVVVGLHHAGFDRDENTCKPTEEKPVNKAIWMAEIVKDILSKKDHIENLLGHDLRLRLNN